MDAVLDKSFLQDLALPVVAEVAPGETELYPLLCAAYFDDPARALAGKGAGGPLAFGLPELYALVTPVALEAMKAAVYYLVGQSAVHGWRVTKRALRYLFRLDRQDRENAELPPDEMLVLTPEQWATVREIVAQVAVQGGMPADLAGLIADAVVGRGVTGAGREQP
jgi:hypothetical protein